LGLNQATWTGTPPSFLPGRGNDDLDTPQTKGRTLLPPVEKRSSAVVAVAGIVVVYVPVFTCRSSSLSMRTLTVKEMMTRNPYLAVVGFRALGTFLFLVQ
jgi:hypothetical protein